MPRRGENIFKRKDGRWEGRYIKSRAADGKAVYGYVYSRSYQEVKRKLCTAIANPDCPDASGALETVPSCGKDFCFLAEKWLQSIRPQIKESTYIKYRNILRLYIYTEFKNTSIDTLTPDDIYKRCNHLLTDGGIHGSGLSPKTVADILSVIRSILRYAHMKNLHPSCTGREISIKQTPGKTPVLSHGDQKKLCGYLLSHLSERNLGILLCLFTGIRLGELCALKWEDISLCDKTIRINKTMQRIQLDENQQTRTAIIVTTPKSSCSVRTIPLPENIIHLIQTSFPNRQGYLLTGNPWKFTEPRTMQNHFRRILQENNIEPLNFHSLRHTFATRCVEVGFDLKSLSEILGHASVTITMNRYVHPTMELKKENMQRLSETFLVI